MFFSFCFVSPLLEASASPHCGDYVMPRMIHEQTTPICPDFNHPQTLWSLAHSPTQEEQKIGNFVVYPCKSRPLYFACLKEEALAWMSYFKTQEKSKIDMLFSNSLFSRLQSIQAEGRTVFGFFRQEDISPVRATEGEVADLSGHETFKTKIANLSCNAMLVANLVKACTSQHGESQTFADILGVSTIQLSQLKQPLKYQLNDNSPTVVKAWNWFLNTDTSDILRITQVSEQAIQEALEY